MPKTLFLNKNKQTNQQTKSTEQNRFVYAYAQGNGVGNMF